MRHRHHRGQGLLVCVPGRAKSATRRQSQRPATRARPINAERKALLLGTALVSTFLLGGMLAPSPIAAQTIVISQEQIRNNNAKRTTGLEAEITFSLARYNNLEADQSITLINDIVVNNSGDIDPVIAISADIYNYSVNFENFSPSDASDVSQENAIVNAIVVANSGGLIADDAGIVATVRNNDSVLFNEGFASNFDGGDFGIRDQTTEITQTNTLTNAIIVLNTDGDIVAGQDGIDASVHNSLLQIQNAAESFNDSFGDGDILTQIAEVEQANVLANLIEVGNGAAIVTNNSGIGAGILNDDVYLYNGCACGIGSINFGSADILSQTAETGQYNVLGNAIVIENDGDVVTGIAGISVAISNRRTELKNDALVLNENYGGADSAVQSAETNQINLAVNAIVIDNGGSLDPLNGIYAGIDNTDIRFLNEGDPYLGAPGNVASAGTPSFSTAQSGELLQSGDLTNTITIENRGAIDAGAGIIAQIRNVNAELENFFVFENVGESIITDSLAQSVELLQTNTVSNAIAVANTGPISAGLDGVRAEIDNEVLFLNEALLTNLADGNIGQLEQTIDVAQVNLVSSNIAIENRGEIQADGIGIVAEIRNRFGFFNIVDAVNVDAGGIGQLTQAIDVEQINTVESHISIANQGTIRGGEIGIFAAIDNADIVFNNETCTPCAPPDTVSVTKRNRIDSSIGILNTGLITAQSLFAIDTEGARTSIVNTGGGVIEGFVNLTDLNDRFDNQAGSTFEARRTSDFGAGNDLFRNDGTVRIANDPSSRETAAFVNLERFENRGLITLVDGRVGDTFEISNTSPAARDLTFVASGNSTLAVDAFLGGPGSVADEFIIHGNITGKTALQVNNTNPNPGAAGAVIPVIVADGDQVNSNTFFLPQPIDTGFFEYDLFFRPTGSGVFELRSFIGGGALLLPQLVTGTQDIWHATSSTWFDRTADLRVLLAGGGSPIAYDPTPRYADGVSAGPAAFTPAVWARGGGNWLDRERSQTVTAYGRDYRFNLDRDLEIIDFQMGLDLGKRDLLSQGDILVFGMLGGFVGADLDYNQLARGFDFEGGQIGGYATYLRGGLFVDTLLNAHLLELETATLGFPSSLDATTLGLRTDTGYRFGSFNGGAFIEPLATLAVLWSDIDGFSRGGNTVSFDDEANVRGRLGIRVGTSYPIWGTTTVEPFVIGSLWGNLSGDNQATLVSTGTTFRFEDDLDDVWGEVSAGVNFFNPSALTAVFAKLDVTFGDDVEGIGGKAGMRVSW